MWLSPIAARVATTDICRSQETTARNFIPMHRFAVVSARALPQAYQPGPTRTRIATGYLLGAHNAAPC